VLAIKSGPRLRNHPREPSVFPIHKPQQEENTKFIPPTSLVYETKLIYEFIAVSNNKIIIILRLSASRFASSLVLFVSRVFICASKKSFTRFARCRNDSLRGIFIDSTTCCFITCCAGRFTIALPEKPRSKSLNQDVDKFGNFNDSRRVGRRVNDSRMPSALRRR
jgi:hypothetical protein